MDATTHAEKGPRVCKVPGGCVRRARVNLKLGHVLGKVRAAAAARQDVLEQGQPGLVVQWQKAPRVKLHEGAMPYGDRGCEGLRGGTGGCPDYR